MKVVEMDRCPDALTPDGPVCPRCGMERGPSGVDGGSWVHTGKPGPRNVDEEYRLARDAALKFDPGEQPDFRRLMRAAYTHGYAQALIDRDVLDECAPIPDGK